MNQLSKTLAKSAVSGKNFQHFIGTTATATATATAIQQQRKFSQFENYSKTCENYDTYRCSKLGVPEILESLQTLHASDYQPVNKIFTPKKRAKKYEFSEFMSDLHVLDAGCGTGNYIKVVADLGVGRITGLEYNEGMLRHCQQKLNPNSKKINADHSITLGSGQSVRLYQGSIVDMPFKNGSFDTVMVNMVLQHVDDDKTRSENFLNVRTALQRCAQVLSPNGQLIITTSTPTQIMHGLWYYQFFPKGTQEVCKKYCTVEWWENEILDNGFNEVRTVKNCDTSMTFETYYDFEGPFKQEWRNADSSFAMISDSELEIGLKDISQNVLRDEKQRELFYEQSEQLRMEIGHGTAIIARKIT